MPTASEFVVNAARVRFVLVQPSHPGNIGAAARAIRTMGFGRLAVVTGTDSALPNDPDAIARATQSADVLAQAQVTAALPPALGGARLSFAMTGYAREFGPPLVNVRQAAALARAEIDAGGEVAYVFGTERSGLANEDVERCTYCCAIPADPQVSSLNLAQAVQIAAYECQLALRGSAQFDPTMAPYDAELPARHEALQAALDHLERALVAIGYLDPATPRRLMSRLRRLFGRARPTDAEIDILRGIFAAIELPKRERAGRKRHDG